MTNQYLTSQFLIIQELKKEILKKERQLRRIRFRNKLSQSHRGRKIKISRERGYMYEAEYNKKILFLLPSQFRKKVEEHFIKKRIPF